MSRLRQRFYLSPLVLSGGHLRPVVDLFDVAWNWLADIGDLRLVQVFAKADTVTRMDRDRRLQAVQGAAFDLLQELTHRDNGPERLRDALLQTPDLAAAAALAIDQTLPRESLYANDRPRPAPRPPDPGR